jgi:hypothetical protein
MKTKSEMEYLKLNWMTDPCWDIEKTEGFEDYHDKLLEFRLEKEKQWQEDYNDKIWAKSCRLGIEGNIALTKYIIEMEKKIEKLSERMDEK